MRREVPLVSSILDTFRKGGLQWRDFPSCPNGSERTTWKIAALPDYGATPFASGPQLNERRVAIVTTAGLHRRDDRAFEMGSADYRVIPGDTAAAELVMSHISVNHGAALPPA